ncbi:MAG: mechanosensitive ion channel domain-containing protein [bacterium]
MRRPFIILPFLLLLIAGSPIPATAQKDSDTSPVEPSSADSSAEDSTQDQAPIQVLREKKTAQLAQLKDADITPSLLELAQIEVTTARIALNSLQLELQGVNKSLKELGDDEGKAARPVKNEKAPPGSVENATTKGTNDVPTRQTTPTNKPVVSPTDSRRATLEKRKAELQREITQQQEKIAVLQQWQRTLQQRYEAAQASSNQAQWEQEKKKLLAKQASLQEETDKLKGQLASIAPDEELGKQKSLRLAILLSEEDATLIGQTIQLHDAEEQIRNSLQVAQNPDTPITELQKQWEINNTLQPQLKTLQSLIDTKLQLLTQYLATEGVLSADERKKVIALQGKYKTHRERLSALLQQVQKDEDSLTQRIKENQQKTLSTRNGWPESAKQWLQVVGELRHVPGQMAAALENIADKAFNSTKGSILIALLFATFWLITYVISHLSIRDHAAPINRNEVSYTRWMSAFIKQLLEKNLLTIFAIIGLPVTMRLVGVSFADYSVFFMLLLVFAVSKPALTLNRLLYQQQSTGIEWYDRELYEGLKFSIILGAVLVTISVLTHHLNVSAITRDTFDRLLMLAVLVASVVVFWRRASILEVFAKILEGRPRVFFVVQLVTLLFPAAGAITGAIGLVGYINLSWMLAYHEGVILLIIVSTLIVRGYLLDFFSWWYSRSVKRMPHGWMWGEAVVKPLEFLARLVLMIIATLATFRIFGWSKDSTVVEKLTQMLNHPLFEVAGSTITPSSIIMLVAAGAFFYWSAKWSREFAYRWLFKKIQDHGIRNSLSVFTQYTVVLIGLYILLKVLGINLTALAVMAGAIGVGIGFGLQTIANNFISGILLLIERPFRTGDYVNIGSNEGWVTRIGIRSLTVRTRDNIEVIIPNTDTITNAFMNWTHMDNIVRFKKTVGVSYNADPHQVKDLIIQVLEEHPKIVADPAPAVWLDSFGDSSVDFTVWFHIDMNRYERRQIISEVMFGIWDTLKEHGIEIPFPQRDINFRNSLPLQSPAGPAVSPQDSPPEGTD